MIINLEIENIPTKKEKLRRVVSVRVRTDIEAIGTLYAVAELDNKSPLAVEVDKMVLDMMAQKKDAMVKKTKKLVAKKRAKAIK